MPLRAALLAALGAGLLAGCGLGDAPPPSVLLLTVDTLRPDYMSLNGYDRATTPVLDGLIGEGFYFEGAVAPVARTTPSLATLLTGAYPHTTGVFRLTDALHGDVASVAELLRERGYQTVAVVTNQVLSAERRLDRGFDVYDMAPDTRAATATTDAAIAQLAALSADAPALVWVHYIDPHVPYHTDPALAKRFDPEYEGPYQLHFGTAGGEGRKHQTFPTELPKGVATHHNRLPARVNEHIRRLYAADIRSFDQQVERLLAAARERLGPELLVVFTADHGESLGEHGLYFDHGDDVYNAGTRVPLAFVLPASHPLRGRGRCPGWVSLADVVPTLLELLRVEAPHSLREQLEGRSLVPCMRGESLPAQPVFAESGFSYFPERVPRRQRNDVAGRFRAVTLGDFKLVWTPFLDDEHAWELYDVSQDPHETRNLYRPDHPAVPELKQQLRRWMASARRSHEERALSGEDREALRALGYLE